MERCSGHLFLHLALFNIVLSGSHSMTDDALRYELTEGQRPGFRIADLIIASGLKTKHPPAALSQLHFRFLNPAPDVNITVGENSGLLFTNGNVDRDVLCPRQETCAVSLDVAVHPAAYFEIIKVIVDIVDLNDNRPVFPEEQMSLSILESASPDSTFVLPSAVDNDSPQFGIQKYRIKENIDRFTIQYTRNLDGSMNVRLVLRRRLDRESRDIYRFTVIAEDGGPQPQSGSMAVIIRVLDSNDHDPTFDETIYSTHVQEHIAENSVIARVHAVDRDVGQNGMVRYGFSAHTRENYGSLFGIDPESGDVYVRGNIDHEKANVYNLIVTAQDLGPESIPSDATLVVHVDDINDNKPEITIHTLNVAATNRARVSEDQPVGSFVAHISVSDPDSDDNGLFDCTLPENSFELQRRYAREYQLQTAVILDRETTPSFNLAIVCKDHGAVPQMAIQHLQVIVNDINDNDPIFTRNTYSTNLIENNAGGAFVLQVNATDLDVGDNAHVVYSIEPSDALLYFEIHQDGKIFARQTIDREVHPQFQFPVRATDRGEQRRTGSALVIVTIEDVNDEAPIFLNDTYTFSVAEGEVGKINVGSVTAVDNDSPPFNAVRYSLARGVGSGASEAFVIDPHSGAITTKKMLDREAKASYYMVAVATDVSNSEHTGTARIFITINDTNDNPPEFRFPIFYNHTVIVSSHIPVSQTITRLRASDPDIGNNSKLVYYIKNGNEGGTFSLDHALGTITLTSPLKGIDREYILTVLVKDQGSPVRQTEATLNIIVNKSIPFPSGAQTSPPVLSEEVLLIIFVLGGVILAVLSVICMTVCLVRRHGRRHGQKDKKYRMQALPSHDENTPTPTKISSLPINGTSPVNTMAKHSPGRYVSHPPSNITPSMNYIPESAYASQSSPGRGKGSAVYSVPDKSRSNSNNVVEQTHQRCDVRQPCHPSNDLDQCSQHSADGSNTDSGRGASEEGTRGMMHYHHGNLVQPIISGVRPLPPCPPPPPARAITSNYGYATHRGPRLQTFNPMYSGGAVSNATIQEIDDSPARSISSAGTVKVTWGEISTSSPTDQHDSEIGESQMHVCASAGVGIHLSGSSTLPAKSAMKKMESMIV